MQEMHVGDAGSIPRLGRSPGEGNDNPLQLLLPGKLHGWRSLVGYSPWGCKELDTIERIHFPSPDCKVAEDQVQGNLFYQ